MPEGTQTEPRMGVVEERHGAVLVLTLDYPARRNALGLKLRNELSSIVDRVEGDDSVRAVVLTGGGGHFSSGGDLSGMQLQHPLQGRDRLRGAHALVQLMVSGSKPIVAAVEGWAAGAGLSLVCASDTVVAAEDARFVASFGKVGLVADLGLLHTLPRRVGWGKARQMLLYCEPVAADEAERIGLVDHVVPKGHALDRAIERAQALAKLAPGSIALTKRMLAEGIADVLDREGHMQALLFQTADHAEGKAAFFEKREAKFTGG